jgi:hypothetical protein
MEGTEWNGNTY